MANLWCTMTRWCQRWRGRLGDQVGQRWRGRPGGRARPRPSLSECCLPPPIRPPPGFSRLTVRAACSGCPSSWRTAEEVLRISPTKQAFLIMSQVRCSLRLPFFSVAFLPLNICTLPMHHDNRSSPNPVSAHLPCVLDPRRGQCRAQPPVHDSR